MQKVIFLLILGMSFTCKAACPLADSFFEKGRTDIAVGFLNSCALNYNDDESQMKLAKAYADGDYNLTVNPRYSLYYYQLAAETGNAEAQLALAQALIKADKTSESRKDLLDYRSKLKVTSDETDKNTFNGDFIHPYALLMLASESPSKKWYYPSLVRNAPPKAVSLFKSYKISDEKKKIALRQASQFKTRKLLQTAKEIMPSDEYQTMEKKLKNPQTQNQALDELKIKMQEYIEQKNNMRKTK